MQDEFGDPKLLIGDSLPTIVDIDQHCRHLRELKINSEEWSKATDKNTIARCLMEDVASVWQKTPIPHKLMGKEGERRMVTLLERIRDLKRIKRPKRGEIFLKELNSIFDVAKCPHLVPCNCSEEDQVPSSWTQQG